MKTERSIWGSFLCWLMGYHIGNVQWGETGKNGNLIHKCSCCCKPIKVKGIDRVKEHEKKYEKN
jgi:hypothetical protein